MKILSQSDTFNKARLKLTLWYIFISFVLLVIFSLAAINAEKQAFNKIEQALSDKVQRPRLTALLENSLNDYEKDFRQRLLIFDLVLLVVASLSSYFLSGRTLKPIQTMVKDQEEFSANASHELRTPLTTIRMEIEALKRTQKIPSSIQRSFDSIIEETNRMRKLVDGLLLFVRSSYQDNQVFKPFNLTSLAEKIFHQMEDLALAKKLQYQFNSRDNITVLGDEEQVKEVMLILLDNAIKYTPAGSLVEVSVSKEAGLASYKVKDKGTGIPTEDLPYIFERFYRSSHSISHPGAGLGLAIAKQIAESHQGKIIADSRLGKGSTFSFHLPFLSSS